MYDSVTGNGTRWWESEHNTGSVCDSVTGNGTRWWVSEHNIGLFVVSTAVSRAMGHNLGLFVVSTAVSRAIGHNLGSFVSERGSISGTARSHGSFEVSTAVSRAMAHSTGSFVPSAAVSRAMAHSTGSFVVSTAISRGRERDTLVVSEVREHNIGLIVLAITQWYLLTQITHEFHYSPSYSNLPPPPFLPAALTCKFVSESQTCPLYLQPKPSKVLFAYNHPQESWSLYVDVKRSLVVVLAFFPFISEDFGRNA